MHQLELHALLGLRQLLVGNCRALRGAQVDSNSGERVTCGVICALGKFRSVCHVLISPGVCALLVEVST